jgi:hypothetical protein
MKFGEMKILLPTYNQIAFSTAPTIRTLRNKLRNYTDEDFLLLAGDPVAIGLACSIAAFFNNGRYTALKWDRREHLYLPVRIDVTQKGEIDE